MFVIVRIGGYFDMFGIVIIGWVVGGYVGYGIFEKVVCVYLVL